MLIGLKLISTSGRSAFLATLGKAVACTAPQAPSARPLLSPLTGGYRRAPVLQVGADIYCDTNIILPALERLKSISESLRERGYSPKKVFKEIAEERKLLEELGLTPDVVMETTGEQTSASEPAPAEDATDGATDGQEPAAAGATNTKALTGPGNRDLLLTLLRDDSAR